MIYVKVEIQIFSISMSISQLFEPYNNGEQRMVTEAPDTKYANIKLDKFE